MRLCSSTAVTFCQRRGSWFHVVSSRAFHSFWVTVKAFTHPHPPLSVMLMGPTSGHTIRTRIMVKKALKELQKPGASAEVGRRTRGDGPRGRPRTREPRTAHVPRPFADGGGEHGLTDCLTVKRSIYIYIHLILCIQHIICL